MNISGYLIKYLWILLFVLIYLFTPQTEVPFGRLTQIYKKNKNISHPE